MRRDKSLGAASPVRGGRAVRRVPARGEAPPPAALPPHTPRRAPPAHKATSEDITSGTIGPPAPPSLSLCSAIPTKTLLPHHHQPSSCLRIMAQLQSTWMNNAEAVKGREVSAQGLCSIKRLAPKRMEKRPRACRDTRGCCSGDGVKPRHLR